MSLLRDIERTLTAKRMRPTRFGRNAVNDPRLVMDLRRGRGLTPRLEARVRSYLASLQPQTPP